VPKTDRIKSPDEQNSSVKHFVVWAGEHLWLVAVILFLMSFLIRLLLNFWTGPVVTQIAYPDEIRFLHIARSLAEHGQILVRGLPSTYQKILYPLMLSPAFLLTEDQIVQVNIIRAINCLLVSSTVFPVLLLAKKLTSNKKVILISLLFTVTLPDMAYSATFAAETLNMPLIILLFYFAYCAMSGQTQRRRYIYYGIVGFITYLAYLNKESGAVFLVAAYAMLIVDTIRSRQRLTQNVVCALILSAAFFIPFLIMKQTLFQGMGNTYATDMHDQVTLTAISSPGVFFYMIYSVAVFLTAAVMSFYTAPVFITLYGYNAMNEEQKRTFLFTVFSLLTMVGVIAYTIYIREDLGDFVPRLHMRYVSAFVIPIFIQFMDYLHSDVEIKPSKRFSRIFLISVVAFCFALIVLIPHGPAEDVYYDHFTLRSTHVIESLTLHVGTIPVNLLLMLFKFVLMALTIYSVFVIIKNRKKGLLVVLVLCLILLINSFDNFMDYTSIRRAKTIDFSPVITDRSPSYLETAFCEESLQVSNDVVKSLTAINSHLKTLDGSSIVLVHHNFSSFTDTYLEPEVLPVDPFDLWNLAAQNSGVLRVDAQPINIGNRYRSRFIDYYTWTAGISNVDYIITLAIDHPFVNVEVEYEDWIFVILRNLDPEMIYISRE